ncbi:hypothetical protein [Mesorhizobium sp. LNHC252B00]|uniref:hypothetical protein n=1 Tax=Mesorhizobium sp. LNHC252B00 TaxID=1287252 RepID=UPI0012EB770E|nr:hypothetical protein [Mesorhizobium sp. LNHC252B00]
MTKPSEAEWGFCEIARDDPNRARALASYSPAEALIETLGNALGAALVQDVRIGFDGINNDFDAPRVMFQFPVSPALYDWFFNSRTGYRAQYWASPKIGNAYNSRLLAHLKSIVGTWAPASGVAGRALSVQHHNGHRQDIDLGRRTESRATVLASLDPLLSKIWICERLLKDDGNSPAWIAALSTSGPKLHVPQWIEHGAEYGLVPQFPDKRSAWLDIKGGYVLPNGNVVQPNKRPKLRARQIHDTGWS